jgi:hypothetical protein
MWEWGAEEYRWRLRWVLLGEVQDKMDRVVGGAVASGLPQIDVPLKEIVLERRRVEYANDLSRSHDFLVVVHEPLCCARWHRR